MTTPHAQWVYRAANLLGAAALLAAFPIVGVSVLVQAFCDCHLTNARFMCVVPGRSTVARLSLADLSGGCTSSGPAQQGPCTKASHGEEAQGAVSNHAHRLRLGPRLTDPPPPSACCISSPMPWRASENSASNSPWLNPRRSPVA